MKKIFPGLLFLIFGIGIIFAAANYIKTGNNWDANVSSSESANDVLLINGRIDLEDSLSSLYSSGYRGSITGLVNSKLFGDFNIVGKLNLEFKTNSPRTECSDSLEEYSITGIISSAFWGDMIIQPDSFFCSNQYTYINLESDSLGNKEIGNSGGNQNTLIDNFGKQQIAISGIAKLKGATDSEILARGDQNVNKLSVDTQSKILAKTIINKNVYSIMKNLLNNTTLNNSISQSLGYSKSNDFINNSNKNAYYLFDYSSESDEFIKIDSTIDASGKYINKGKIFSINGGSDGNIGVKGQNTIIMQGGNIYINANIYNIDDTDSLLVIVSKESNTGKGGNIYIDPDVTNIDAVLIADGSLISAIIPSAASGKNIQTIDSYKNNLRKQLLIYGSILSSNSVGTDTIPYGVDYYKKFSNNTMTDNIYDLGNLRTFNLNYGSGDIDGDGVDDDDKLVPIDGNGGYEEYAWAGKCQWFSGENCEADLRTSDKKNPLIIEYNPHVKQIAPYILQQN